MIHGIVVCVGILGALGVCIAAAALFILATDKGEGCCRAHGLDLDDTIPYVPTGEQQ